MRAVLRGLIGAEREGGASCSYVLLNEGTFSSGLLLYGKL